MSKAKCDGCGENPEGMDQLYECEDCGRDFCERCWGDPALTVCPACDRKDRDKADAALREDQ